MIPDRVEGLASRPPGPDAASRAIVRPSKGEGIIGTHSDGKPVTKAGFPGSYWERKAERDAQRAHEAKLAEIRSMQGTKIEKTDLGQQEFDSRGPWV